MSIGWSLGPLHPAAAQELRGESELLFEVAREDLILERIGILRLEVRNRLRNSKIGYTGLQGTEGRVEFRIRDTADLDRAKAALASLLEPTASSTDGKPVAEVAFEEPEPGFLVYRLTDIGVDYRLGLAADQTPEVFARRIDEFGLTDPIIDRLGLDRIKVVVGGVFDPGLLKDILSVPSKLTFQFIDPSMSAEDAVATRPPAGSSVLYSTGDPPLAYLVEDTVLMSGEHLVDAQASLDPYTSQPAITFRFDGEGKRLFGEITTQNIGRSLAIIVDSQILMTPVIREPIVGGSGQISGRLTMEDARVLALLLRNGPLPAALNLIESRFRPVEP